jgi:hypothetical protein
VVTLKKRIFYGVWKKTAKKMSIYKCYKLFDQNECICKGKKPVRKQITEAKVATVHTAFIHSPCKSTRNTADIKHATHNSAQNTAKIF